MATLCQKSGIEASQGQICDSIVSMSYSRVLLKISGEQLSGEYDGGIDAGVVKWLADEIKPVLSKNIQIVIMVGGGNFLRGAQIAGHGIKRVTADHMGMLATVMNALAVTDIFEADGIKTRCLSNIFAEQVAESFVHRLANKHLENGRIVIVAGGLGRPYLTTDTAAVSLALELDCRVVIKATKVDGIYNKDPMKHKDAVKFDHLTFKKALEDPDVRVMDKAALGLAADYELPIIVYNFDRKKAFSEIVEHKAIGTKISLSKD